MSQAPFFSIVLPTYNRAHIVSKPIKSVIEQSFTHWELLVIDDGSTDNTRAVVEAFAHPQIRYIYQPNAERSAARNNGIKNAKGTYICFLDSDDSYMPNHLQVLYDEIETRHNPVAMFITGVIRDEPQGLINVPNEQIEAHLNAKCYFLMAKESVIPSRVAIHEAIFKQFIFSVDLKDVEDTFLWIQIASFYPAIQIPVNTAIYYLHDDNSTNLRKNPFANQLKGLLRIFNDERLSADIPKQIVGKKLSMCYYGIAKHYLWAGKYFHMVSALLRSIWYAPLDSSTKSKIYLIVTKVTMIFNKPEPK